MVRKTDCSSTVLSVFLKIFWTLCCFLIAHPGSVTFGGVYTQAKRDQGMLCGYYLTLAGQCKPIHGALKCGKKKGCNHCHPLEKGAVCWIFFIPRWA